MRFAATGDAFVTQRLPRDQAFHDIATLLQETDARFTNLETVIRRNEGFPSAQSGGTWASSVPEVLEDLRDYGFNLVAWPNNHTLDYSYGGLLAMEGYLDQYGFVHAGAGRDLESASAARYLKTGAGRVALIAATATFHESWRAGAARPEVGGRPGVNPLRFRAVYRVLPEKLEQLRAIAASCEINSVYDSRVKEGFIVGDPEGMLRVGQHLFGPTTDGREREETSPHVGDQERILSAVREAATQAQSVIVSIYSHEVGQGHKDEPADFLIAFARACIDAGAHAVIGHGPHILRGIEIYQGRPIFYSLGNFIFQNERVAALPADFYEQYKLDASLTVAEALDFRSNGGRRGLGAHRNVWHSVIARWTMTDGLLSELVLHPVTMGFGLPREVRGVPQLSADQAPLEELIRLSEPFATRFERVDSTLIWRAA